MSQDEIIEMAQGCGLVGMRPHLDGIYVESIVAFAKLVAEKALAQPEQEPVAEYIGDNWDGSIVQLYEDLKKGTKLYTTPPQRTWVDLTDEQYDEIWRMDLNNKGIMDKTIAKLKEKNT